MSGIAVEGEAKPRKAPSLISLSFGGFNIIAIVTSSISILRLLTAHSTITLHGIVADVIDWYKKFFHQTFDDLIIKINDLHIHWLHLPYVSDNLKDLAALWLLLSIILWRTMQAYIAFESYNKGYAKLRGTNRILLWVIKIIHSSLYPFRLLATPIYLPLALFISGIFNPEYIIYAKLSYALLLQTIAAAFAVGSMLILSAYS